MTTFPNFLRHAGLAPTEASPKLPAHYLREQKRDSAEWQAMREKVQADNERARADLKARKA